MFTIEDSSACWRLTGGAEFGKASPDVLLPKFSSFYIKIYKMKKEVCQGHSDVYWLTAGQEADSFPPIFVCSLKCTVSKPKNGNVMYCNLSAF